MFRALLPVVLLLLLPLASSAQTATKPESNPSNQGQTATDLELTVTCVLEDGSLPPVGIRIFRSPIDLDKLPTAAWVERNEVRRGKWRPWPSGANSVQIQLHPTPEVAEFSWRVVAFRQNSMLAFRMASESYREFAVGVSRPFRIDPVGGAMAIEVPISAPLRVKPQFTNLPLTPKTQFRYTFSYGPMGKPPRYAHGNWNGQGKLPISLSPLALDRHATLEMELLQFPCPLPLGPMEFPLQNGTTPVEFGVLPNVGQLDLQIPGGGFWQVALGYISPEQEADIHVIGKTNERGRLKAINMREGRYFLLAVPSQDAPPRPGVSSARLVLDFTGSKTSPSVSLNTEFTQAEFSFSFAEQDARSTDLSEYEISVRCMWGPFLIHESILSPATSRSANLPVGPQYRYQAVARKWDAATTATEVRLYLSCRVQDQQLLFSRHPTVMEVDGYEDGADYTLRLLRGEQGPAFPPLHWPTDPLSLNGLPYLPLPFQSMIRIHGLPEGAYEASLWGWDRSEEEVAELSYHYPVAD